MQGMTLLLGVLAFLGGCLRVTFRKGSVLSKPEVRYRAWGRSPKAWSRVWLEDNDLAFAGAGLGRALSRQRDDTRDMMTAAAGAHAAPADEFLQAPVSQKAHHAGWARALRSRFLANGWGAGGLGWWC